MTPAEIEACVDALSAALNLPIAAAHRPGVLSYFALAASMADAVALQPFDPADEPAEVFSAVAPRGVVPA